MKNQLINLMFALTLTFTIFSCSNDGNNEEIAKYPSIAEVVTADNQFSVLLKGLNISGLTSTFTTAGSYTVLAPTNTAFNTYTSSNFPTGITDATLYDLTTNKPLTTLTTAQKDELKKVLQYHILSVGTLSNDLLTNEYSKTFAAGATTAVNGSLSLHANKNGSDVLINGGSTNGGAKVTSSDINASNGVMHIIDNVLKLPTIVSHVKANPKLSTLLAIVTSTATGSFGDQTAVATLLTNATSNPTATTNPSLTVFAPLNSAFATATTGSGFLTGAAVTSANVTKVLQYHVEAGNRLTAVNGASFSTNGDIDVTTLLTPQKFKLLRNLIKIKELATTTVPANLVSINIQATNGVIHTIDRVLQPVL